MASNSQDHPERSWQLSGADIEGSFKSAVKETHIELHRHVSEDDATSDSGAVKKVVVRLPAKLGTYNITNSNQIVQLLKSKSGVQLLPQADVGSPSVVTVAAESKKSQENYKCTQCEYTSHNKHYLKQHVELVHLAERPFKCPFCDYAGKRSHSLKEHLVVHSSYRPYECHFCNATFRKKGHLTNHIKLHASLSQSKGDQTCKLCGVIFKQVSDFWAHMRESHKGKEEVLMCQSCQFATVDQAAFKIHSWSHGKEKVHQCTACDFVCDKELDMMEHIADVHQGRASCTVQRPQRPGMPVILLKCSECGFSTADKGVLKDHMLSHLSAEDQEKLSSRIREEQAESALTSLSQTTGTEEANQSTKRAFECECGFLTVSEEAMLEHLKTVHTQLPPDEKNLSPTNKDKSSTIVILKCSECGFTAPDERSMKTHMVIHIPELAGKINEEHLVAGAVKQEPKDDATPSSSSQTTVYNCAQCNFSSSEAYVFITHMLTHRPMVKSSGQGSRFQVTSSGDKSEGSQTEEVTGSSVHSQGYVHDMAMGIYRCAICSYTCEHQRTIKAHIWKHSGHKDIDYPMFQNGPLSMFDYTPIGASKLASGKSVITEPRPDLSSKGSVQAPAAGREPQQQRFILKEVSSETQDVREPGKKLVNQKTIASAKAIVEGNSKQVILVPASSAQQEKAALLKIEEASQNVQAQAQSTSKKALKGLLGSRREVLLAPVLSSNQGIVNVDKTVTSEADIQAFLKGQRKRPNPSSEEENQVPLKRGLMEIQPAAIEMQPESPVHVVVEPMSDVYVMQTVNVDSRAGSPRVQSPRAPGDSSVTSEADTSGSSPGQSTEAPDGGGASVQDVEELVIEVAGEMEVGDEDEASGEYAVECVVAAEGFHVEEDGCVEVYTTSQEDRSSSSDVSEAETDQPQTTDDITKEQALTLLSLLKKGPNYNPACPPLQQPKSSAPDEDNKGRILDHSYRGRKGDSKSGISDSLLAAIEHLREVSKSESEEGESSSTVSAHSQSKRHTKVKGAKGGRKRGRRKAATDISPIDTNKNIEKLARDRLRCKLCHYTTTSTALMKTHMRVHKAKNPTECSLCDFVSKDSEELQQHILGHCKVRTYQCKYCNSEFSYKSQLRAHMRAHDDRHPLLCESCDFQTWDLVAYQKHIDFCKSSKSICSRCGHKFCSVSELETHKEDGSCPQKKGTYQCEQCDFSTEAEWSYNKHMRWHGRVYKCEHCEFACTNYKGMANHSRVHFEERDQKCEFCDFVAKSVRSLKSHMKRHANDQRFVQQPLEQYMCNLCGYVCHHLPSLKSHMWRHASDTNYSYTYTNQAINAAIDYDSTTGNPAADQEPAQEVDEEAPAETTTNSLITFCCCQCGFESTDKGVLNNHMKIHNDIIQKTLAVNMGRFAIHAAGEGAQKGEVGSTGEIQEAN